MTKLHAGGKFGGGGYAVSAACTAFISVVNAEHARRHRGAPPGLPLDANVRRPAPTARLGRSDGRGRIDRHVGHLLAGQGDLRTTVYDFETLRAASSRWRF
ncbi:MAG: hypothetical protein ACLT4Y_07280 [Bifidobacterium breve]